MEEQSKKTRKRLYLGLMLINLFMVIIFSVASITLMKFRLLLHILFPAIYIFITLYIVLIIIGAGTISLNLLKFPLYAQLLNTAKRINKFIFPTILKLGKITGFSEEEIKRSLIEVNNKMIVNKEKKFAVETVLLIAPHCLQNSSCSFKITRNPDNCKRCDKCQVSELLRVRDRYGIKLAIASGGTSAKMSIQEAKPSAVIAIACERDLINGIQECGSLPVYGILNNRPNGPCHDTFVNIQNIEEALETLVFSKETQATGKQMLITD